MRLILEQMGDGWIYRLESRPHYVATYGAVTSCDLADALLMLHRIFKREREISEKTVATQK